MERGFETESRRTHHMINFALRVHPIEWRVVPWPEMSSKPILALDLTQNHTELQF